jgi:hypothetical protein
MNHWIWALIGFVLGTFFGQTLFSAVGLKKGG